MNITREEAIKNILEATTRQVEEEEKAGTMTPERYVNILAAQNSAILAVINAK